MAVKPNKVEIRSYNVGFGDCFLLSFLYDGRESKHVLIDFGSTLPPDPEKKDFQVTVAEHIREQCGGKLHAVVATHRHKDHISGFATNAKGTASGNIIRECADAGEALVLQPWTEDPDAPTDSTFAKGAKTSRKAVVQQLDNMHTLAEVVAKEINRLDVGDVDPVPVDDTRPPATEVRVDNTEGDGGEDGPGFAAVDHAGTTASRALRKRIAFIGEDNVKNLSAVQNLLDMSTKARHRYLFFGADSGLQKVLPGVKVHVLGPPTIQQHEEVQKMRSIDPNEFWMLRQKFWQMQAVHAETTMSPEGSPLFPNAAILPPEKVPRTSRWFIRRLRGARAKALLEMVLIMDDAMNNTSLILLFEVGGKKLLFPGDAQIENWEFALADKKILKLLAGVDVYKVGHHGSRNATPKTLWNNFEKLGDDTRKDRLTTLISTKAGKHGAAERHTEVPRKSLVAAMKESSTFKSTQSLRGKEPLLTTIDLD